MQKKEGLLWSHWQMRILDQDERVPFQTGWFLFSSLALIVS
jgi:hypothetical protein